MRLLRCLLLLPVLLGPCAFAAQSRQATSTEQLINWYYAAVFGTGVYTAGDRTVGVLQLPFGYSLQPPSAEQWGIKLTLPLTFGFYNFGLDQLAHGDLPNAVNTVSALPGLQLEFHATDNWRLQPFVGLGKGWEFDTGHSAVLYNAGVMSQLTFPMGRGQFMLGNTLSRAGYDADNDVNRPLTRFITGLNFIFPSNGFIAGRPVDFGLHLIHYLYFDQSKFPLFNNIENRSRSEFEMGFSFSVSRPLTFNVFKMDLFDVDRIGFAVRTGENITGVRLFFSLPY
jgi:hypothetical protein